MTGDYYVVLHPFPLGKRSKRVSNQPAPEYYTF